MNYTAKPIHLLFSVLLYAAGSMLMIQFFWFSIGLWFLGTLAAIWIFIAGLWQSKSDYNLSLARVAEQIRMMNPEQWNALGIRYPELRIKFHGKPIQYLEDSDIRLECFQKFLDDSDEYQFAPERLYGDGTQLRNQWRMSRDWLIGKGFIIDNSAAGNHTWLWRTGRRQQLISMYFPPEISMVDLNQTDPIS